MLTMPSEIEIREIEPTHVASTRATTIPAEIAQTFAEKIQRVGAYMRESNLQFVGPPYSRYFEYSPERVEMEIGIVVKGTAPGNGEVAVHDLPGGTVATTLHLGPYDRLSQTYDSLRAWIDDGEYEQSGAPWEIYITDPGEEPDSERWQTRIFWPIQRRNIVA